MNVTGTDVDRFLKTAWEVRGTDLLLTVGAPPMIRVDGHLRPIGGEPLIDEERIDQLLDQVLDRRQIATFDEELDLDFAFSWGGVARVRGNAFYQRSMPAVALRLIPDKIPTFDEIGLPEAVRRFATLQQGLVLFTGPTGSGKSTSLASILEWINYTRACHVITIEDPIEYVHTHRRALVSQREVGLDTTSFARGLHAALREDPDVVLVGEMRDLDSIATTLTLAETGHLVFSTLHTNDSAQALDRIVDVFPTDRQPQIRMQLSNVLTAVVAQRLVPMIEGGLTAAFEVLVANSAVRNLILEGKTRQLRNSITMGQADGMQTLEMSLNGLVRAGRVNIDDARAIALVPNEV
jgi:twitching motility protein PilT